MLVYIEFPETYILYFFKFYDWTVNIIVFIKILKQSPSIPRLSFIYATDLLNKTWEKSFVIKSSGSVTNTSKKSEK